MAEATSSRTRRSPAKRAEPRLRRVAELGGGYAIAVCEPSRGGARAELPIELARVADGGADSENVELLFCSGASTSVSRARWEEVRGDLKELVREELASLDALERERVLERVVAATAQPGWSSPRLSSSLHGIREVLRERLPRCAVEERQPVGLSVESLLAVDDRSFWINGWMHDHDGRGAVVVVSPEGARMNVSELAFHYERPDVVQFYSALEGDSTRNHGFTAFFSLPAPSLLADGWIAEAAVGDGLSVEIACPTVVLDPSAVRSRILGELGSRPALGGPLVAEHGRHALTRLQARAVDAAQVASIDVYGEPARHPRTSIVIPLYKRLDFVEHQLLHFSRDPDLAEAELIYVLDSVEQTEELANRARELFALYGLPFKVVNLTRGAGFAGANRHGIDAARGARLLLLNSDVIPDRLGWIEAMNAFYDAAGRIGALGPKLLYEDDSLQHAGLYFHRAAGSPLWENAHCFKGLHRRFPAANVPRAVPAVTAACMLIDRDRYEQVGGLPLHYVQGDYEDSELCLRLAEAGYENWYLPTVELYHLEGQSYLPESRRTQSEYNMWLHTALWGPAMERAMSRFDPHAAALEPSKQESRA
jgi:GT2 family glycosyltransferase